MFAAPRRSASLVAATVEVLYFASGGLNGVANTPQGDRTASRLFIAHPWFSWVFASPAGMTRICAANQRRVLLQYPGR